MVGIPWPAVAQQTLPLHAPDSSLEATRSSTLGENSRLQVPGWQQFPDETSPLFEAPQGELQLILPEQPMDTVAVPYARWMGKSIETTITALETEGWEIVTRTPRLVQFNRGQRGLDLMVDALTGEILDVALIDLI